MEHKIIADLLRQGGFLMVNKNMLKMFGINNALVLSILLDKGHGYNYEHFFCTREYIQAITGLDLRTITKTITFWRDMEVVSSVKEGVPATTYYTVNVDTLVKIITPAFEGLTSEYKNPLSCSATSEDKSATYSESKNEPSCECKNALAYIYKINKTPDNKTPDKKDSIKIDDTDACARVEVPTGTKNVDWKDVMSRWNKIADQYTMPKLLAMTPQRKINFMGTLSAMENPTVDFFFAELERIMATSYFLQGIKRVDDGNGYRTEEATTWVPSFDWFIRPGNFVKYREGKSAERSLVKKWERFHKKQTTTEKEGVTDAEKGDAL